MSVSVTPVAVEDILAWRDLYREEMHCQIVHDNMHARAGWTQPYLIEIAGAPAGYGSVLIGGPWTGTRTGFEFYLSPSRRTRVLGCFEGFLAASQSTAIKAQTNDKLLTIMLHLWAHNIVSEKIVFEDTLTTAQFIEGAVPRPRGEPDKNWVVEIDGAIAAKGGIMYHYSRPYGDIYLEVSEPFRRRGLGTYLVQELKRICYELGSIPCALQSG